MTSQLQAAVVSGWLPPLSALWWPNDTGNVIAEIVEPNQSTLGYIRLGKGLALSEAIGPLRDEWVDISVVASCQNANIDVRADVGDGAFSGDGWVAAFSASTGALLWVLFSDSSDPFVSVKVNEKHIVAESSQKLRWIFPVASPAEVVITN